MSVVLRKADEEQAPPLFSGVHGSFFASDVRQGERILCKVRKSGTRQHHEFSVWRISPFGIELVADPSCPLAVQQIVELSLEIAGHEAKYRGCVVGANVRASSVTRAEEVWRKHGKSVPNIVAVRLDTTPRAQRVSASTELRKEVRWACHRLFYPTGSMKNTARFNDRIYFRVSNFSLSGMQIVTSLRNRLLAVGLPVNVDLLLPSVGRHVLQAKVVRIDVQKGANQDEEQVVGLTFPNISDAVRHGIGQYILQFGGDEQHRPTPSAMKASGFDVYSVSEALEFDVVRTEQDYKEVLALRSLAFRGVKGLNVQTSPEQMADVYDTRARILACKFRGHVVGTVRLCFHGPNDQFEEEAYTKLPANFPKKDWVVEASRAATHPDFRGTDLFLLLMRYTLLLTLQAQRRYIVQSTYDALVPIYRRMGFRDTGARCPHPTFPGKTLHLLLVDVQQVLEGRLLNPLIWCALFPQVLDLVEQSKTIRLGWVTRQRLRMLRLMVPVYTLVEKLHFAKRRLRKSKKAVR